MRILCFGDSNTYGFDPRPPMGGRYSADNRWVDLLAAKTGWEVINAGENGREIPRHESEFNRFQRLFQECAPIDRLTVMLGGNDLLRGASPETVADRMEAFLTQISMDRSRIILIASPPIQLGSWVPDAKLLDEVAKLTAQLKKLADKLHVRFIDTSDWSIELAFDGVHLTENGHRTFAQRLHQALT